MNFKKIRNIFEIIFLNLEFVGVHGKRHLEIRLDL